MRAWPGRRSCLRDSARAHECNGDRARVREHAAIAADLLGATIGSSDALSERGIATLVRLRGKRRVGRCAGSIGGSNVAFRGIKPDPATAIQAVTGSGLYDG